MNIKEIAINQNWGILVVSPIVYPQLTWWATSSWPSNFFLGVFAANSSCDLGILTKNIDINNEPINAISPNLKYAPLYPIVGSVNYLPAKAWRNILPTPPPQNAIPKAVPLLTLNQAFISVGTPIAETIAFPTWTTAAIA